MTVTGLPSPTTWTESRTPSKEITSGTAAKHTGCFCSFPGRANTLGQLERRGGWMKPDEVKKLGVMGCGLMGSGITEVGAKSGMEVAFVEVSDEKVQKQKGRIEKSITKAVEKGKLPQEDAEAAIGRISGGTDIGAASE